MRWIAIFCLAACNLWINEGAQAHHPEPNSRPVRERIDVIGPVGNRFPPGHRRKYNRPTYWGGKLAHRVAPTSREAMAWHKAEHRGDYDHGGCRPVPLHFYPKPYEQLRLGSRKSVLTDRTLTNSAPSNKEQRETSDGNEVSRPGPSSYELPEPPRPMPESSDSNVDEKDYELNPPQMEATPTVGRLLYEVPQMVETRSHNERDQNEFSLAELIKHETK